jgi:2,3-bisphosphoglycerate-dependent phosphoglycerate mutase
MKTVYFVRHGVTELNKSKTFQFHDTPLSKEGQTQALLLAERFKNISIDALISSDMLRAKQTAEAIGSALGLEVSFSPLFQEVLRPSVLHGKLRADSEIASIAQHIEDNFYSEGNRHSDEENFYDLRARGTKALQSIVDINKERVAVVSHGEMLFMLVALMMYQGNPSADEYRAIQQFFYPSNTGITVCVQKDGRWRLMNWNDDAHLGVVH